MYYMDVTHLGERVHRSTKMKDKAKALQAVQAERERIERAYLHPVMPGQDMTLSEALEKAYRRRWKQTKDGDQTYKRGMKAVEVMGDLKLEEVTTLKVDQYRDELLDTGIKDVTANRYMEPLRACLRMAHLKWGVLGTLPVFDMSKEDNARDRVISPEEEAKLLKLLRSTKRQRDEDTAKVQGVADMIEVMLNTGIRPGELFQLRQTEVDLDRGVIHLLPKTTKNGKPRTVPMNNVTRLIMRKRQGKAKPFPFNKAYVAKLFRKMRKPMGLEGDETFIPYACRHTACTRMLEAGVTLSAVGKILGHSSAFMTERYGHLSDVHLSEQMALMDRAQIALVECGESVGI